MNGRIGAGRTGAGPRRVTAAAVALGVGVLHVVVGSTAAWGVGGPAGATGVGVGQAATVAAGSTCTGEALDRDFPQVRHGHVRGTLRAV